MRNETRENRDQVPVKGILGMYNKLEIPSLDEGFSALYHVSIRDDGIFKVEDWNNEI